MVPADCSLSPAASASMDLETSNPGSGLDVVIVYGFDCTTTTPAWNKMDEVYWLVHEKLTCYFAGSSLGYVYVMSTPNTYTCDMKLVDSGETAATGYKGSPLWRRTACTKNMASGLKEALKLIRDRGYLNAGVILFFSDGSVTKGDYFDATETFASILPVHTFTLAGDAHNEGLRTIAGNSPGGTFNPLPVPDKPKQSEPFSRLLHNILSKTTKNNMIPGKLTQNVFIVYAFDSTTSTPAYKKVDEVFWMVHKKLINSVDSSLGYIYVMSTPNTYTLDMKLVDSTDKDGSYQKSSVWRRTACTKNMASGLYLANKLINDQGRSNGIILFFSDGLINKGDFFDGVEGFIPAFPVHTFTVGGDAYNQVLRTIAENSPDGTFNPLPVPDKPEQSAPFSELLR